MNKTRGIWRCAVGATAVIWMLGTNAGCTRMFYRKQADNEVDAVLREKDIFPQWKIQNMQATPDPRARFADPTNPDRPPMPPDDPATRFLGPNPQKPGHPGVARVEGTGYLDLLEMWDAQNRSVRTATLGSPEPANGMAQTLRTVAYLQKEGDKGDLLPPPRKVDPPVDPAKKPFLITIDQAMELGLINSREFQTRREDLYLTALPVTRERFAFAAQFFAIGQVLRERTGANFAAGDGNRWQYASATGMSKLFSTGALLLVGFANQTVLNLGNPPGPNLTSATTFNLDFIQPLLRGGGRAATLEPLTLVERNLLYEIRNYARFRRQYYQYMIGGSALPNIGITAAGNFSVNHPFLSTQSAVNFARQQIAPSTSGQLFLGVGAEAPSTGYLPTMLQVAQLQYLKDNVVSLEEVLRLYQAYQSGGQVSPLQVGQVELQLLQGRSNVLTAQQALRDSVDNFKLQLGIPLDIPLDLDDSQARPITDQLARFNSIIKDYEQATKELDNLFDTEQPEKIRAALESILKNSNLTRGAEAFRVAVPARWEHWRKNYPDNKAILDRLEKLRADRRKLLDRKSELEKRDQALAPKDQQALQVLDGEIGAGELELSVRRYEKASWRQTPDKLRQQKEKAGLWRDLRNDFALILIGASKERFERLYFRWPELPSVVVDGVDVVNGELESSYEAVTRVAFDNRLDLMNNRAQVVDAWRQVRVFANALLGTFNVAYHMDSATPPTEAKPLAFRPESTRHQLVMNMELPLIRVTERNAYRACLIAYQRARRNLQEAEDQIAFQVRSEVRQLQVIAANLKIQQKAVELAYQQVESSLETFRAPQVDQGGNAAANAAALTQQLLNAYANLPRTQNQLLATWTSYQIARQQLLVDLDLLPLDARGVWVDEFSNTPGRQPAPPQR